MKQRILAIGGALALVALAIVARTQFGGDDGGGSSSGGGKPVVACTADLMSVCAALADAGKIAEDPPTLDLDRAAKAPREIDGWITWDPAPGIANFDADSAVWGDSVVLGSSPLGLATLRSGSLGGDCGLDVAWSCVNTSAGRSIAVGNAQTAEGLARFAPIAESLVPADGDIRDVGASQLKDVLESPTRQFRNRSLLQQRTTLLTAPGAISVLVGRVDALDNDRLAVTVPDPSAAMTAVLSTRLDATNQIADATALVAPAAVGASLQDLGLKPGTGTLGPSDLAGDLYAVRSTLG